MPGCADDPVRRHDGQKGIEGRGMSGYSPWVDIWWRAEQGGAGIRRIATQKLAMEPRSREVPVRGLNITTS